MLAENAPMGILRVEREVARRLLAMPDLKAIPVVFRSDGLLMALSSSQAARFLSSRLRPDSRDVRLRTRRKTDVATTQEPMSLPAAVRQGVTKSVRRVARSGVAHVPSAIREDVRSILIHGRQILRTVSHRNRAAQATTAVAPQPLRNQMLPSLRVVVHPGTGDVLWTAGLYSNFVPLRKIAEMRARTGFGVVTTCYDLIRVTHPQFNSPSMGAELFVADTVALLDASDHVLAISDSTRRELLAFAERLGRACPPVEIFPLGSNLPTEEQPSDLQIPVCPHDIPSRFFALAVGTVEPRKNYGLLVRVWEQLAADPAFSLDLVIVGRLGFEAEQSAAEIEASPLFGSRIFWLESCPDELLWRLYETCHCVVYPSFAEGWGFPVAEALGFGRYVIVSDRGALPEAGQGLAQLVDPTDQAAWAVAISEAAAAPRRTLVPPHSPTWDDAAATTADALRRCMGLAEGGLICASCS
jgi:glycosyltransferase involved in cell wall biosynthesis